MRKFYLREPVDEGLNHDSEKLLSFTVIEDTVLVKLLFAVIPLKDEFVGEDFLVVHELHEGLCELGALLVVFPDEVENDGLEKVLDPDLAVRLDELNEDLLILLPVLDGVPLLWVEETAHEDEVLVFIGEAERDLGLLELLKDLVSAGLVVGQVRDFLNCVFYTLSLISRCYIIM